MDLKYLLKNGVISEIIPETGGGISGEAHLLEYECEKYIVRICKDIKTAKKYERLSLKLEEFEVFPKFLGRYGKKVFYEFLEGRDLKEKESSDIYFQIGKIAAVVGTLKGKRGKNRFYTQLEKLETGNFYTENSRIHRAKRRYGKELDKRNIKAIFSKEMAEDVRKLFVYLSRDLKLEFRYDINDTTKENFRLSNEKVYFVDIEAITPRIKGLGIANCFLKMAKDKKSREAFRRGFEEVAEWYFEGEYADLCYLMYTMQSLVYRCQVGREYVVDFDRLKMILKKYEDKF